MFQDGYDANPQKDQNCEQAQTKRVDAGAMNEESLRKREHLLARNLNAHNERYEALYAELQSYEAALNATAEALADTRQLLADIERAKAPQREKASVTVEYADWEMLTDGNGRRVMLLWLD